MFYLFLVSLIWAFSFGLIKTNLMGLDSTFVSWARILISFLVFLPFLRFNNISRKFQLRFALCGALQYGVMYIMYIYSYKFLKAHEVALFTIFTPIYITFTHDFFIHRFSKKNLTVAILAVIGTGIIVFRNLTESSLLTGFFMMQISNICFAFGQIYYRELMKESKNVRDYQVFGLLYLGAVVVTSIVLLLSVDLTTLSISMEQFWTLLYLGVIASGLCFFLWNYGARQVDGGVLAVFNNVKVPLAVFVSIIVFRETTDLTKLLIGGGIVFLALILSEVEVHPGNQEK